MIRRKKERKKKSASSFHELEILGFDATMYVIEFSSPEMCAGIFFDMDKWFWHLSVCTN